MIQDKPLKILMLEDNTDDINLIERVLQKSKLMFSSQHVDTRDEFIESVQHFRPDVILSDHGLPQFNSREALKIAMRLRSATPFIIVTGTMSDEFAIECLQDGADDYLLKSNLARLPQAITRAVKERRLQKLKRDARHQLRKQNKELQKVNDEMDNFFYSVSHNLRGPLASVLGLLDVARMEDVNKTLDPVHTMMHKSISQLDETLKGILDFARNARSDVRASRIEWNEIISKSIASLRLDQHNPMFSIIKEFNCYTPFYSDHQRIKAIVTNILSNVVNFYDRTRAPYVKIEVTTDTRMATIRISDNGIGIRPEFLPRIFEMFYRGTEVSNGAGLGLYITRETVNKLKGDISITSVPETGTVVLVTIPNCPPMV